MRFFIVLIWKKPQKAGYHDELKGFTKLELMEFDDKQIADFVDKWFGKKDPDKVMQQMLVHFPRAQLKKDDAVPHCGRQRKVPFGAWTRKNNSHQ